MSDLIAIGLSILFVAALGVGAHFRIRYVTTARLTDERLADTGDELLTRWRTIAPDIHTKIPMNQAAWASYGLTTLEAIQLARYLEQRGQIVLPEYSLTQLLMGEPPSAGRLTQNSWEGYAPSQGGITVNGPAHFGVGDQINSGTFTYQWDVVERDLTALSFELETLIRGTQDEGERGRLRRAASVLDESIESQDLRDPRLVPVLRWLETFVQDTTSGAAGSVIASLAMKVIAALGLA